MQHLQWFVSFLLISPGVFSQVAINKDGAAVLDPTAMLEVKNGLKSKVKIRSLHYTDTSQLELSNRTPGNQGTDFFMTARREQGLFFTAVSDLSANSNDSLLTILTNGRVGIGKKAPLYKLDVNGDINLNNSLRVNGSAGSAGQVLTATGTGAPEWRATAFTEKIRFGARFYGTSSPLPVSTVFYNLSPANISMGASSITINQSGLYHFEGVYSGLVQGTGFTGAPEFTLGFNLTGSSTYSMNLCTWKQLTLRTAVNNNWYHNDHFSIDMHITAPATLSFSRVFLASTTPTYSDASVTIHGYLISE